MNGRPTLLVALAAALCAVFAAPAQAELSPEALLAQYQPVTVLDATEAFAPTAVDGFLADARLQRLGATGTYETVAVPPPGLPVHGSGWRLDLEGCSPATGLASVACYAGTADGPSVVYGRHDVRGDRVVLQYWYLYDYNFWSLLYPRSDFAWQAHEGDWEAITVVLDEQQSPVEVAYSQHCTGERRAWAQVPTAGVTHPVAFVATGSHANLFAPGVHPIALACYPPAVRATFQQNGIVPLDFAVPGRVLGPGSTAVERIHENAPRWVRFPGTWGEAQYVRIPPPFGPGTIPFGTAPVGPRFHDVWVDPLGTIAAYPAG